MYLTREELATYRQDGVLRQRQLIEPELVSTFRDAIQQEVLDRPSTTLSHHSLPPKERLEIDRHLDSRLVYDLCTRPEVLQPLTQILGEDIMLFRSRFFDKQAWSAEIPWHQESYFWKVDKRWVTVWFAIDDVTTGNGLLQLVPGSHHSAREHMYIPKQHSYWSTFKEMACMKSSDPILDCPTPAGEFIFFDDLLHRFLGQQYRPSPAGLCRPLCAARHHWCS